MSGENGKTQENTYECAMCHHRFEYSDGEWDAEKEAEQLWGIAKAKSNPDMVIVCDACFNLAMAQLRN
jgi:hypothetical protein